MVEYHDNSGNNGIVILWYSMYYGLNIIKPLLYINHGTYYTIELHYHYYHSCKYIYIYNMYIYHYKLADNKPFEVYIYEYSHDIW